PGARTGTPAIARAPAPPTASRRCYPPPFRSLRGNATHPTPATARGPASPTTWPRGPTAVMRAPSASTRTPATAPGPATTTASGQDRKRAVNGQRVNVSVRRHAAEEGPANLTTSPRARTARSEERSVG